MSKPSDLVQGTLDMLMLKILALEPLNGCAVSQRLKQVSSDVLAVSDGSLYPALHMLEQRGWLTAHWNPSGNNRRARFYSLTQLGRKQLEKEAADWNRLSAARSTSPQLVAVNLVSILGGLAPLLAAVGLYGVMSYGVAQSIRELGLRCWRQEPCCGTCIEAIIRKASLQC